MRKGIWIHPDDPAQDLVSAIRSLELLGIDQVWIGDEGVSRDPFVILAAAAMVTDRIELGIGVTNPLLRHPGVVASAAATIAELSRDRFILGWGSGGTESLTPLSLKSVRPLDEVSKAIHTVDAVLSGRSSQGYTPPKHAISARKIRQYIGARGPKLNTLASRIADGVFLSGIDNVRIDETIALARSIRPIEVALYQTVRSKGVEEPGVIVGEPGEIATRLSELIQLHSPTSIGVACIDDAPLADRIELSVQILDSIDTP